MDIIVKIESEDGVDKLSYVGPINEEAEVHLGDLIDKIGNVCEVNFSKVEYVNSCGVRSWINFMRDLGKERKLSFVECTPEIVLQINMIPSFRGTASIDSVFASYECTSCGNIEQVLFEAGKNLPGPDFEELDEVKCGKCGQVMEMEEIEEEYFSFTAA